ncbi:MAG: flagellar hook-basal body complex protein FliE [Verrucomicrobiota bacterium]
MLPLSSIHTAMPAYAPVVRPEMVPGMDSPLPVQQPGEVTSTPSTGESFGSMLGRMVEEVNNKQTAASQAVQGLQSGGNVSLHQAVIAMEEASVSFQLMVEVRNRLLESYQEIMRMQV